MKQLLFIVLLLLSNLCASAAIKIENLYYNLNSSTRTAQVTYYSSDPNLNMNYISGDLIIPSSVEYNGMIYSVTSISAYAFRECSDLRSVTIPPSVTSIGSYAFFNCTGLKKSAYPSNFEDPFDFGVSVCYPEDGIIEKNGVIYDKHREKLFFVPLNCINEFKIPYSITSIENCAFYRCSGLTSIEIPNSVTSIGEFAFEYCTSLSYISLSKSLSAIGKGAFSMCSNLREIDIPDSVTTIEYLTFYYCENLSRVKISSQTTSIGEQAFEHCQSLSHIDIPNTVLEINSYAFSSTGLKSIIIPESVKKIGNFAFSGYLLEELRLPNSDIKYGFRAFNGCPLKHIYNESVVPQNIKVLNESIFGDIYDKCILYVPDNCLNAYSSAEIWKEFKNIIEISNEGIWPERIWFNYSGIRGKAGETGKLSIYIEPEGAVYFKCIWSSSDEDIISINEEGEYTFGSKYGRATITAYVYFEEDSSRFLTAICEVTCLPNVTITWNQKFSNIAGDRVKLEAYSSNPDHKVIYRNNYTGYDYKEASFIEENENNFVLFKEAGPYYIEAYIENFPEINIQKKFNVLSDNEIFFENGLYYKYLDEEKSTLKVVPGYEMYSDDYINIPSHALGLPVLAIDDNSFNYCTSLKNIEIEEGVMTIGRKAFYNSSVSNLTLPSTIKNIEEYALNTDYIFRDIYVFTPQPISISPTVFKNPTAFDNCTLHVPMSSVNNYKNAAVWQNFKNISGIPVWVESIQIRPHEILGHPGDSGQFIVSIDPEGAMFSSIQWSSSDKEIVTIDNEGNYIFGEKLGTADVTAIVLSGNNEEIHLSATAKVTVIPTPVKEIILTPSETQLKVGETANIKLEVLPLNATNKVVEWNNSNPSVASVNAEGIVTALAIGETTIKVSSVSNPEVFGECHVEVVSTPVTSIKLNHSKLDLNIGQTDQLIAVIEPENATDKNIRWESSNKSIASVNSEGYVTGMNEGVAVITAWCGQLSAACEVNVIPILVEEIQIDNTDVKIVIGDSTQISAIILPENATNKELEWIVDNPSIADVSDEGIIRGKGEGQTIVWVSAVDGSGCKQQINVTVTQPAISLVWNQTFHNVVGDKIKLEAYSPDSDSKIVFRRLQPDGGFRNFNVYEEGGEWFAEFTTTGPHMLEAYLEDYPAISSIRSFNVIEDNDLMLIDGIYYRYTDDTKSALKIVAGYEMYNGDYKLPSSVKGLPVKYIDSQAFYSCKNLGKISIEEGIESIKYEAFGNNTMTEITIPSSLLKFDEYVFNATQTLTHIYMQSLVPPQINENNFNATNAFKNCTLHVPSPSFEKYKNADVWRNFNNILAIPVWANSIVIEPAEIVGRPGDSGKLSVVTYPELSEFSSIQWSSSDEEIIMVDKDGHYIINDKEGNAVITVTVYTGANLENRLTATCNVSVRGDLPDVSIIWDQIFHNIKGDIVELGAYTNDPKYNVRYRYITPNGGFRSSPLSIENGKYVTTFSNWGPYLLEAYVEEYPEIKVQKRFNVLEDHDVTLIDGIYYRDIYNLPNLSVLKVVMGYEPYEGDLTVSAYANEYQVKWIDHDAFMGCENLGEVKIEEGLESLGRSCFSYSGLKCIDVPETLLDYGHFMFTGVPSLKDINIRLLTPPVIHENNFDAETYEFCTLHVPEGCMSAYASAPVWQNFKNIFEDLERPQIGNIVDIHVDESYSVYTITGLLLIKDATKKEIDALSPGIYIIGDKKVMVK